MEFLNISDIKLKVTLSPDECVAYGIDTTLSDFSGADVRRAIREVIAAAERECGFKTAGDRVLVQLYPLPDARAELLVTRLVGMTRRDRAVLSSSEGVSLMEHRRGIYRFDTARDLLRAVRAVYREGVLSDLYRDDLGRYYISVGEDITDGFSDMEALVEFGDRLSSLPIAVLSEYGELIAKGNALEVIYSGKIDERE